MKIRRIALRLWIAGSSFFTFLVGLAMLAHAPKPVQASGSASQYQAVVVGPMQTLAPMAPLDFSSYFNNAGPQVSNFSVQDQPTAVPQPQIAVQQPQSVVQQPQIVAQQQASSGQKKGKAGNQQGGGSGGGGGGGGLSTGGS